MKTQHPHAINRPLVATVFCILFVIAAVLSYYSAPGATVLQKAGGADGDIGFGGESPGGKFIDDNMHVQTPSENAASEPEKVQVISQIEDVTDQTSVIVKKPENANGSEDKDVDEVSEHPIDDNEDECKTSRRKQSIGVAGTGPRFQYIHVPKTGGSSIQTSMVSWVFHSERKIVLFKHDGLGFGTSSFSCPPASIEATMLMGHRGFGFCDQIETSPRGLFTFATFRKATSRIISLFDYNLNRNNPRSLRLYGTTPLSKLIKMYNSTPEIEEGEALLRFHGSQQIRFMCGYECMGPNAFKNTTMNLNFMMQRAIVNLQKVDVIGITEELNSAIIQLKFHLPFLRRQFGHWPEENGMSHNKKSVVDDEAMAILTDWAKPDQQLYDIAKKLYEKKDALARKCLGIKA